MEYLRIKETYKLREEPEGAIIFNCNVEKMLNKIHKISKIEFAVLQLMNGQFTKIELAEIYSQATGLDINTGKYYIESVVKKYEEYIEYLSEKNIRENLCIIRNSMGNKKFKFKSFHRLSSPLLLSLVLTYECNCYCKYCFVNASKNNVEKNILEEKKVINMIEESKRIGIAAINITGGDPFVRKDIYNIIRKCIELDIEINISTKERLTKNQIKKLKSIGLKNIQISLDSLDNNITKYLTGIENFSTDMVDTINNLICNDINVTVNSVVTKLNINDIPKLIKKLNEMGVKRHFISPYLRTLGRHDEKLFPGENQYLKLDEFIKNYDGNIRIDYKSPNYNLTNENKLESIPRCSGGRMGIVVIPNGDVTICERLLDNKECIIGNINKNTIQEIREDKRIIELIEPRREKFMGTECYICDHFDECILDKGLCYARCKIIYGNIYNKDPLCPKESNTHRFI